MRYPGALRRIRRDCRPSHLPRDRDGSARSRYEGSTHLGELPQTEQSLVLHRGDILELTRDCSPAPLATDSYPRIGCTLPEIFDHARLGEKVHLDDGRISGEIVSVSPGVLGLRIDHAADAGSRLRAGKGINVPDAHLPISALTEKDVADLSTVVELADLVEMSFVRDPSDVAQLLDELNRLGDDSLGIVLKIETRQAFEHLPQLLLTLMRRPRVGVMIARGDLAVECGYERLAELQEEILWLCEAAHLPVIWATQVLEQLAKTGQSLPGGDQRRGDERTSRMRDAQQGAVHQRRRRRPRQHPSADGRSPLQEERPHAVPALLAPRLVSMINGLQSTN